MTRSPQAGGRCGVRSALAANPGEGAMDDEEILRKPLLISDVFDEL